MRGFVPTTTQWRLFAVLWLLVAAVVISASGELARQEARASAGRQATTASALHAAVLRSELERHRSLPLVLAQDPDLTRLLDRPDAANTLRLNRKLESLAREVRAAAIYALDADGITLAASNWRQTTSFVGSDYRFRPYYFDAMRDGQATFFALGTVSGRPGLYLSRRVDGPSGRPLGVIVAKVEFGALEAEWRASGEPTYVTGDDGVVLITTVPAWRFHAARPLSADLRRRLAATQTAGTMIPPPLPFMAEAGGVVRTSSDVPEDLYAVASDAIPDIGWRLTLLSPAGDAVLRAVAVARWLGALSVALLAALTGILLRRRQRAGARASEAEQARVELERQIDLRTSELRSTNDLLNHEIDERRRLESVRQDLQDELIQANKLATLGQIAAGVAHEINQPVAAIRTHADSASVQLRRENSAGALRSLASIDRLTERVGIITDELRAFARKTRSETVAVGVDAAIDGALLLVAGRLREKGITLGRRRGPAGLAVRAERNRLEQVVLNLLQNAIEALDGVAGPSIKLGVEAKGETVVIHVTDNGPGVAPAVQQRLFTPFTTDKRDGLGLGLVISRDIVAAFGGELALEPSPTGARFVIRLARAA
ncbi:sensor histidine kinase [Brevundimonas sp. TWP2-3-4b2]|uniref:sensor histidine kinase n=1 Tax=Brevundimonas sp. TWP2-3-4b2 TaxID=2804595 RepID=UPI003CF8CD1C